MRVRDERTRHYRRLRRLRGAARRWTVAAGGLVGVTAVLVPYQGVGAIDAVWAGLAGGAVVLAWLRWTDARALAAQPAPDPPDPAQTDDRWLSMLAQLPGGHQLAENIQRQRIRAGLRGSPAAGAWERLDRSAQTLRQLAGRLRGYEPEALTEAAQVERELRALTERVVSLERAVRVAPAEARPPLQRLRDDHLRHLDDGVDGYEQFVVAAAGYLSESAQVGEPEPVVANLTHATDRLRGVTAALVELRGLTVDVPVPGDPSAGMRVPGGPSGDVRAPGGRSGDIPAPGGPGDVRTPG